MLGFAQTAPLWGASVEVFMLRFSLTYPDPPPKITFSSQVGWARPPQARPPRRDDPIAARLGGRRGLGERAWDVVQWDV